jgi:hypothetical protein
MPDIYNTFSKQAKQAKDNKIHLKLDNRGRCLYLSTIDFRRENSAILLFFPPHCSRLLQLRDVGMYGPVEGFVSSAIHSWMKSHTVTQTIYNIPRNSRHFFALSCNAKEHLISTVLLGYGHSVGMCLKTLVCGVTGITTTNLKNYVPPTDRSGTSLRHSSVKPLLVASTTKLQN